MTIRKVAPLTLGVLALYSFQNANAQAPFTIRRPSDGSTVREKVKVEIPRSSIKLGSFVAFYIDDKFLVAVAPPEGQAEGFGKPFTFYWDTKVLELLMVSTPFALSYLILQKTLALA